MIAQPKWTDLRAHNLGARREGCAPRLIVLHDTANVGTHNETLYLASRNEPGVSACFTVERDGSIWKLNPDLRKHHTYHAGFKTHFRDARGRSYFNREVNWNSIGIEICQLEKVVSYPDVQVKAVAQLCAWLMQEFKLKREDITTHAAIDTGNRRSDPRKFPWAMFESELKSAMAGVAPSPKPVEPVQSVVVRHEGPYPLITVDNSVRTWLSTGRCSKFGGPGDSPADGNNRSDWKTEGLAFLTEKDLDTPHLSNIFGPAVNGLTGMARRLRNKDRAYLAMRWDKSKTPYAFLKTIAVRITSRKTGKSVDAIPADWGPAERTGRIVDCSDWVLDSIGAKTDDDLDLAVPMP